MNRKLASLFTVAAVVPITLVAATAQADWLSDLEAPFREALESGNYTIALAFIFAAGLATSLTPCVYPMIAITVSVFGAREAKSRAQGMLLSTVFVLGIAALFTPLGVVSALSGNLFSAWLSNPWLLGFLAIFFVVLSLSMFGAFELNLPPALQNKLAQAGGVGYKGAFVMGLVSGLIAAPCTGPPLLVLLGYIGKSGDVTFGALGLFFYSIGLGLLFWLVGTFAVNLPKSGKWLEWVKSVFGAVMIVMALYYIRDLLPFERPAERAMWLIAVGGGLLLAGIAIGGIHLSYHGSDWKVITRKTSGIAMIVLGATAAIWYLEALPPGVKIAWQDDYEAARAQAEDEGRPLMVDFTASWCGACGELDRDTFSDPRVVAASLDRGVIPVKIDLSPDKITDEKEAILSSYEQRGLPLVVLHDREGEEVARVTAFMEPDEFLELLERVD